MTELSVKVPDNFSFKSTIYSHGWSDLLPFHVEESPYKISYTLQIKQGSYANIQITSPNDKILKIQTAKEISELDKKQIIYLVRRLFRLDEDYSDFYSMAETSQNFTWICDYRAGRMLRCASLWEDMVKMLCTTNCTWRLTQIMTGNLVKKMGIDPNVKNTDEEVRSFPDVETVAKNNEIYLRNEIKMGYRAPYLLDFARAIVNGEIYLSDLEDDQVPTQDLYKLLKSIKGFGDYAASNLLKLLGRYDYLGADSWSRKKFSDKHFNGNKCDDKKIGKFYEAYGKWAGLFFWMDVSEDWYRKDNPW